MKFTSAWDETKPAGTRSKVLGDDDIREFKKQFRERFAEDHRSLETEADDALVGFHDKATLLEQGSDPAALADAIIIFGKLAGSYCELHTRHENAGIKQLTLNGLLWLSALSVASEARGDLAYRGASVWGRLGLGTAGYFLKSDGTDALWAALALYNGNELKNASGDTYATALAIALRTAARTLTIPDADVDLGQQIVNKRVNFSVAGAAISATNDSYGISSVQYVSTGRFKVNFTVAFPNANYSVGHAIKSNGSAAALDVVDQAASYFEFRVRQTDNQALQDPPTISLMFSGDAA